MTSVSSLGGSAPYISGLDKNGDGIVSAEELSAANTTNNSGATATKASTANSTADSASITQKIAADILSLMLQLQQSSEASDTSGNDGAVSGNSPKGILALMDSNADRRPTASELFADPSAVERPGSYPADAPVLADLQTVILAYQNT